MDHLNFHLSGKKKYKTLYYTQIHKYINGNNFKANKF